MSTAERAPIYTPKTLEVGDSFDEYPHDAEQHQAQNELLAPFYSRIKKLDLVADPDAYTSYDDLSEHDHAVLFDLNQDLTKVTRTLLSSVGVDRPRSADEQSTLLGNLQGIDQLGDELGRLGAHIPDVDMRHAVLSGADQLAATKIGDMLSGDRGMYMSSADKAVAGNLISIVSKSQDDEIAEQIVDKLSRSKLSSYLHDVSILEHASVAWQIQAIPEGMRDALSWRSQDNIVRKMVKVETLSKFTGRFGFTSRETYFMYKNWIEMKKPDLKKEEDQIQSRLDRVRENMINIAYLGDKSHSLPKELHDKLGIRNFNRYDPDHLASELEPDFKPDGVVLSAVRDNNAAFDGLPESARFFGENLMFIEAINSVELIRRLIYLRKRQIPVTRMFVAMHGTSRGVNLGPRPDPIFNLSVETVNTSGGIRRLVDRGLIDQDCEVVMWTCRAAKPGGIAKKLHQQIGFASMQAPGFDSTGVERVDPKTGQVFFGSEDGQSAVAGQTFTRPRNHK